MGRASKTVNIPAKPVPERFKIWALANEGYILDWLYHAKGDANGTVDLDEHWIKEAGFSKTQAVVLDLLHQEGLSPEDCCVVWLDNLFSSARLFTYLRDRGIGAAGTVRTSKTAKEEPKESHGTKPQKKKAEPNRGLLPCLAELELEHNSQLEWGKLYGGLLKDGKVLQFAWKDQNVVLFMTTVHTGHETVKRKRRRAAKTATNARTSRAVFGEEAFKELSVPEFIDMYNHFMNGVDITDQLRSYYTTQRIHIKNWKPLWHFLLDVAVTNAHEIAHSKPERPYAEPSNHFTHRNFRRKLASDLFARSERIGDERYNKHVEALTGHVRHAAIPDHGKQVKMQGKKRCVACVCAGRKAKSSTAIKPLQELSVNSMQGGEKRRPPFSMYGCALCSINLCKNSACWIEHLNAVITA